MSRVMLDRWADKLSERKAIAEFWEWLESGTQGAGSIDDVDIEKTLDQYHGIDKSALDRERRELLSANTAPHVEATEG